MRGVAVDDEGPDERPVVRLVDEAVREQLDLVSVVQAKVLRMQKE